VDSYRAGHDPVGHPTGEECGVMTTTNGHLVPTVAPMATREAGSATGTGRRQVAIVLADDHAVVREGLRSLLTPAAGITVVAEAEDAREAVAQTLRLRPNVLLLGLSLPLHKVSSLIRDVLRNAPGVAVLVFSERVDQEAVTEAIRAGARGYINRATAKDEIAPSVYGVAAGWSVFSPPIADSVSRIVAGPPEARARAFPALTDREYEILDLMAAGRSNADIACRLGLASKTISNHVSRIFVKLGFTDRANAIVRARDAGLGRTAGLTREKPNVSRSRPGGFPAGTGM
jgi:DNA-binding NarL/FixJ family response regulator